MTYMTNQTANNACDEYRDMTPEQLTAAFHEHRSNMVNVCMNLTSDFNKSSIVRSHSAFLGRSVIMVGKRKFDRRGAVGTHHYVNLWRADTLYEVVDDLHQNGYTVYAVDNTREFAPVPVYDVMLPDKSAFVYGEENAGLSHESLTLCDQSLYIPQYGPVPRSINVACAASIMMSEYNRIHRR